MRNRFINLFFTHPHCLAVKSALENCICIKMHYIPLCLRNIQNTAFPINRENILRSSFLSIEWDLSFETLFEKFGAFEGKIQFFAISNIQLFGYTRTLLQWKNQRGGSTSSFYSLQNCVEKLFFPHNHICLPQVNLNFLYFLKVVSLLLVHPSWYMKTIFGWWHQFGHY